MNTGKNQLSDFSQEGILRCARYAFMPNKLSFCGPDKNKDLFGYCSYQKTDQGLNLILKDFQVMYPYLRMIASSNKIKDPFDKRVIEAYWIGNSLLENISKSKLYWHLLDKQKLKKKLNRKLLKKVISKIPLGAKPHHSFHVLSVWKRTGNLGVYHMVKTMDLCRISWGEVMEIGDFNLKVRYKPLVLLADKLGFGSFVEHNITYKINDSGFVNDLNVGDWISFHWNFVCEKLNLNQVANLEKYTKESIKIVNS